jgi:hypothetical protein
VVLAAQWLYLFLGLNLGTVWGMATAGAFAHWIVGPSALDYPAFLQVLPLTFSYVETLTFLIGGAFAIPMVVGSVLAALPGGAANKGEQAARVRGAYVPTFIALTGAFALIWIWQLAVVRFLPGLFALFLGHPLQVSMSTWGTSILVGYAMTTLVIYVPVVAVGEGLGVGGALREGIVLGRRYFLKTYPLVLMLSLPALALQIVVQLGGTLLAVRTRPENTAIVLFAYAALSILATYFVWNMAARLYRGVGGKE